MARSAKSRGVCRDKVAGDPQTGSDLTQPPAAKEHRRTVTYFVVTYATSRRDSYPAGSFFKDNKQMGSIVTATFLHYGSDYLEYAFASLYPYVDEMLVFYSDKPNQGITPAVPRPETKRDMMACLTPFADKVRVIEDVPNLTGIHVDLREPRIQAAIRKASPDADTVVQLDADEVWEEGALAYHMNTAIYTDSKFAMVDWFTLWRSFGWQCIDRYGAGPVRLWRPREGEGTAFSEGKPLVHCGWARSEADTLYKISTWGHAPEVRQGWWEEKFLASGERRVPDVHPTRPGFWNPIPHNRRLLPDILLGHPYCDLEVIR